jgi:hypothetical protein
MTDPIPQEVIHFNFPRGLYLFDARPIWTAIRNAGLPDSIGKQFGPTAVALVNRSILMDRALQKLDHALKELYALPELLQMADVVDGKAVEEKQYNVLLYTDAVLFEFRSYLDLIANFANGVLTAAGKAPGKSQTLSTARSITLLDKKGELIRHNYLLYLSDQLGLQTHWYEFLNSGRHHFTHQGAPDCVLEVKGGATGSFEAIITKTNIIDFSTADPDDYFRISELQQIVNGVLRWAPAVQNYIQHQIFPRQLPAVSQSATDAP